MARFINPVTQPNDNKGRSEPNSKLLFFDSVNTTTPKQTFADVDLTVSNSQPVVADGAGRFPDMFLEPGGYFVEFRDKSDVLIWSRGDVNANTEIFLTSAPTTIDSVEDIAGRLGTADGEQIIVSGWHPDSIIGGGLMVWDDSVIRTDHNGGTIFSPTVPFTTTTTNYLSGVGETDPSELGCWIRVIDGFTKPEYFGAIGGNANTDSAAMQAALDANLVVKISDIGAPMIWRNIVPNRGQSILGDSQFDGSGAGTSTFIGDGANPVFLCGDGGVTNLREITFKQINGDGNGNEVILGRTSPNLKIIECDFDTTSATKNVIDLELCFRCEIRANRIIASGGGWAMRLMDNINGALIEQNTCSGGSSGGAIKIGTTQGFNINNNIIETSQDGIWVSSSGETGDGICSGFTVANNYIEVVDTPLIIADNFICRGGTIDNNYIGNTNNTGRPTTSASIRFGRLQNCRIRNNAINVAGDGTENVFDMFVNLSTGDIDNNDISNNNVFGTPLAAFIATGSFGANASVLRNVGSTNYFDFMSSLVATHNTKEYISDKLTCNQTIVATTWLSEAAVIIGGTALSIDIIEASGALDGLLRVGRVSATTEIVDQDLSLLTIANGHSTVVVNSGADLSATENSTIRLTAGVLTTTFRVKIRYRAV